jgi:8-oxo-dGTP pyrophosphatase MutT (NUDIX family)
MRLIDVYPYQLNGDKIQFLLLHRSPNVIYSGTWRMIGGKVNEGETSVEAAFREFQEETGQKPVLGWVVPTINAFYDPKADQIRYIPVFAFQCGTTHVQLNHEHDHYGWFDIDQAEDLLAWHEQKRIIRIIHTYITSDSVLPEWQLLD